MPELTIKPGVIVVASAFPDPPFEVEIDGADSGFDAELMQAICRPLGLTWRLDTVSGSEAARSISFEETAAGSVSTGTTLRIANTSYSVRPAGIRDPQRRKAGGRARRCIVGGRYGRRRPPLAADRRAALAARLRPGDMRNTAAWPRARTTSISTGTPRTSSRSPRCRSWSGRLPSSPITPPSFTAGCAGATPSSTPARGNLLRRWQRRALPAAIPSRSCSPTRRRCSNATTACR